MDANFIHSRDVRRTCRILTREEQVTAARAYQAGDREAGALLVQSIMPLVRKLAFRMHARCRADLDVLDLVQAGSLGAMRAVKKFNPDLGYTLSTYATRWIKQFILFEINRNKIIAVPHYALYTKTRYREDMDRANGAHAKPVLTNSKGRDVDPIDLVASHDPGPPALALQGERIEIIHRALRILHPRDRAIAVAYYLEECTLEEVGQRFGVTRERVRQINARSLKRMHRFLTYRKLTEAAL